MSEETLAIKEAYLAMFAYMDELYRRTKSDDLGGFVGEMALLVDGKPVDAGCWEDWINAIARSKSRDFDPYFRLLKK